MLLNKFSWREVRARPSRVLLTFLSIAIGVAAVVAVLLATSTTRTAQKEMLAAISGKADVEILANSPQGFPYEVLKGIRDNSQVSVAIPTLNRVATVFAGAAEADASTVGERTARIQVLGIDPRVDQQIREYRLSAGQQPVSLTEVMLDESLATSLRVQVGDTVKLLGKGGLQEFQTVGLVEPTGQSGVSIGGAVYLVLPAAQKLFRASGNVDQVLVSLVPTTDRERFVTELKDQLGPSVTIRVPRSSSDMAQETMYATENGMRMAFAFALLIAIFIIYNTFQMSVGERRKQLGVLRAIGATRSQVFAIIMREALVLSVLGTLAGCMLGYWGAGWLNGVTERVLQVELPVVRLSATPFIVASFVGVVVSLVGALLPARRASQVQPIEAMRNLELQHNVDVIRQTRPVALVCIPLGLITLLIAIRGWLPVGFDVVGIVLCLLGCVALIPLLLEGVTSVLVRMLRSWLGVESKLAQKQLLRNVGRSTLTIGVLFVAVSTCVGMAGNILDNVANVQGWYSKAVAGDFFVRASMPDFSTGAAADLPKEMVQRVAAIDGVQRVQTTSFVTAQSGEDSIVVIVRSFQGEADDYFDVLESQRGDILQALNRGQTVIGSVLAQRRGLIPGDKIPLETDAGSVELEIAAVVNEYLAGGLTLYLSQDTASELLGVSGISALVVNADNHRLADVEAELRSLCSSQGLILQSHRELVDLIDGMVNGVIASMWMLLGLGCAIAAMGLVNTLTMNIMEQTREIGMLRVVAMTRGQVRRMVFAQATLMGAVGLLPGALAGVFVAFAISQSSLMVLGHSIAFRFRPGLVLGCVLIGAAVIALASWLPAERATRLKLATALRRE
ncbi:MAG: FtsX-like permease family protein [bacterium]|nr:FtsX-like permease family protein [bacterium]